MPYVALKAMVTAIGPRQRGDYLPEADGWRNLPAWVGSRHIKEVPASEIVNGRWVGAAGSPVAPTSTPVVTPAPLPPEVTPVVAVETTAREELRALSKAELLDLAARIGVEVAPGMTKGNVIDAILRGMA